MTDEELIARLRRNGQRIDHGINELCDDAADRIDALLNLNEALVELMDDRDAKLAKAVEVLEQIDHCGVIEGVTGLVCATLAEIKGEKHDTL